MKKIDKIINVALMFTLIGVFLCPDALYSCPVSRRALRVPVGDHERIEQSLNPIRKIRADEIKFIGEDKGGFTVVGEVQYRDERGVTHECFAKLTEVLGHTERFIIPQARILRFLNSRNIQGIPKVLDFVKIEDGKKIILFERFPEGKTLGKKIGALSKEEAVDIMLKVTRIVKSLLDHGVYHWDIKPSNIWVTNYGEVILFDFDLAFMGKAEFIDRGLCNLGTEGYMSEKRQRMKDRYGFQLGGILFSHADEIFSLGETLNDLLLKIDQNQIPPDLQSLINRALIAGYYDIGEYKTIDEFLGDLEKVAASMVVGNKPIEIIADARHVGSHI